MWEKEDRKYDGISHFYWKGLKNTLDTVLLKVHHRLNYLPDHKERPGNNSVYKGTEAVTHKCTGKYWKNLINDYDPLNKSVLLKITLKIS